MDGRTSPRLATPAWGWPLCCWPNHPLPPPCPPGTPLRESGSYLTPAVAAGVLAGGSQKEVTLVNALLLAQEAGLKVRGYPGLHVSAWHTWGCLVGLLMHLSG